MKQEGQLTIVEEIKLKINEIKDRIKEGSSDVNVFNELTKNAKLLQDKLNELLSKSILTQSDINDAYVTLQNIKRNELSIKSEESKTNLFIYLGIGILAIYAISQLMKND